CRQGGGHGVLGLGNGEAGVEQAAREAEISAADDGQQQGLVFGTAVVPKAVSSLSAASPLKAAFPLKAVIKHKVVVNLAALSGGEGVFEQPLGLSGKALL